MELHQNSRRPGCPRTSPFADQAGAGGPGLRRCGSFRCPDTGDQECEQGTDPDDRSHPDIRPDLTAGKERELLVRIFRESRAFIKRFSSILSGSFGHFSQQPPPKPIDFSERIDSVPQIDQVAAFRYILKLEETGCSVAGRMI